MSIDILFETIKTFTVTPKIVAILREMYPEETAKDGNGTENDNAANLSGSQPNPHLGNSTGSGNSFDSSNDSG